MMAEQSASTDMERVNTPPPKWAIVKGDVIPQTVMIQSWVGRCNTCGFVALGHASEGAARTELRRHHQAEHADEYPTHNDGSPCFHTMSGCTEHGSCMDCDLCKTLCECNW